MSVSTSPCWSLLLAEGRGLLTVYASSHREAHSRLALHLGRPIGLGAVRRATSAELDGHVLVDTAPARETR